MKVYIVITWQWHLRVFHLKGCLWGTFWASALHRLLVGCFGIWQARGAHRHLATTRSWNERFTVGILVGSLVIAAKYLDFACLMLGKRKDYSDYSIIFSQMVVWWWFIIVKKVKQKTLNKSSMYCWDPCMFVHSLFGLGLSGPLNKEKHLQTTNFWVSAISFRGLKGFCTKRLVVCEMFFMFLFP